MDRLIYGKNEIQRITSIEINDSETTLFIRNPDSTLTSQIIPHKYWILAPKDYPGFARLKGDLYYKYGRQFKTMSEYASVKSKLKDKDYYSIYDVKEQTMVKEGVSYFKGMKPSELAILSFDLETTGIDLNDDSKVLLISATFRNGGNVAEKKLWSYDDFFSQGDMIDDFCKWVREKDPDVLLGHNVNSFDIPYLKYCAARDGVELLLGRDGSALKTSSFESKFRKDGSQFYHYHRNKVYGREIIDTMFLALKYDIGRKYESYGLKKIITHEGLEKENRTFYDASQIRHNYKNPVEWEKIKDYCRDDSDDALALFDLMAPSFFHWTQIVPKSFQSIIETATGSQVNAIMVRSYLQEGHSIPKADEVKESFTGAISAGNPGIYHNCIKWDVASLYPSIMIEYNIHNPEKDPNGNFINIVKTLTEQRLEHKRLAKETGDRYYKDLEQSEKIGINSAYGFLGAKGLNFNFLKGASLVTEKGREILRTAIKWSTGKDYEIKVEENEIIS